MLQTCTKTGQINNVFLDAVENYLFSYNVATVLSRVQRKSALQLAIRNGCWHAGNLPPQKMAYVCTLM